MVPRPAAQIAHAVDADTDFGMMAEVDQVVLGPDLATAPACALAGLASLGLSLSTHGGSRLPPASVAAASLGCDGRRLLCPRILTVSRYPCQRALPRPAGRQQGRSVPLRRSSGTALRLCRPDPGRAWPY